MSDIFSDEEGPLTFAEFHKWALPVKKEPDNNGVLYQSNAMCGEAGEVANVVKKMERDGCTLELDAKMVKECGDVLFYMRQLLERRGFTMQDAAEALLHKLDALKRGEQVS